MSAVKERMIEEGLRMLLERGYNGLGVQAVLETTNSPKGSFYHYFRSKEDFALKVIDTYVAGVHALLDRCMSDRALPPLQRIRLFFETVARSYRDEGYLGCLMGGLGQELSGVSEVFREKIEWCFSSIAQRLAPAIEDGATGRDCAGNNRCASSRRSACRLLGGRRSAQQVAT
ncbi:TetR/AcrR family transcriptional regulator [Mesorhizobium sp. ORS 3428]|uniref:TetR/AcrR family transcriptional regulator n=1 Tax=Mesorhizobium sp. ORS 3428 TaxID=540997 RepID=UPI00191C6E6F|nr:TetR/AcrR family transcriptional regulator [Mesorhizobium sp. ORS 3428]